MKIKLAFLSISFVFVAWNTFCQNTFEKDFKQDIIEKTWSAEDTTQKADYEQMFVLIFQDSITIAYVNWLEGMSANQCSYTKKDKQSCFELTLGKCGEPAETNFVYGNLSQDKKTLNLLFADKQITDFDKINERKGWLHFELLTE